MSGIVSGRLMLSVAADGYVIEPEPCPAEHPAATICYAHDELHGTRQCPWYRWSGKLDTRRQHPGDLAESARMAGMSQRRAVVMCELARRNRGPGLWPTLGAPKLDDE